jgi:hypothetical protein
MNEEFFGFARKDNASINDLRAWLIKHAAERVEELTERFELIFAEVNRHIADEVVMVNYIHGKFLRESDGVTYPLLNMSISTMTADPYRCMVGFVTDLYNTKILTINFYGPDRLHEIMPLVEN